MARKDALASRVACPDSAEAFFSLALEQGWSDGLPMVPSTEERVATMVAASGRAPDEVIGPLPPSGGIATVEKVAANAVMAGCLPEYMPVLLSLLDAVLAPEFNLHSALTTTHCVAPVFILNGPVRSQLGVNCSYGALGPGWRANATIGRAFRLIAMNIGGSKPGVTDRSLLGLPSKYTCCLGEAEEESPWEPLHVERGIPKDTSAVTAVKATSTADISVAYKHPQDILTIIADAMDSMGLSSVVLGTGNPLLLLTPGQANLLYQGGWTKQAVKEWLYEHSRIAVDRFPKGPTIVPVEEKWARRGDYVYITSGPERILIVVAGGAEPYHGVYCAPIASGAPVTRAIAMPNTGARLSSVVASSGHSSRSPRP